MVYPGYPQSQPYVSPPGNGFAIAGKGLQKSVTLNVTDLRKKLNKYLDDFAKDNDHEFPQRPMRLRELHAEKELAQRELTKEETAFLKGMVVRGGGSGMPPVSGWYPRLFTHRSQPLGVVVGQDRVPVA